MNSVLPVEEPAVSDPAFSQSVVAWQRAHGRHALPWQQSRDPYRVWLSEIMLQQTQVAAVIPYYQRFLERFPDLPSLAAAETQEVMALWSGLGYYSRARNLHRCAQAVVQHHGGQFPQDPKQLEELPGIGRSTAAAIAAFSFGCRSAIMDGNVKRVFSRVFGIETWPGEKKIEQAMWLRAQALLPEQGIESYTQGLMDLGATVCTRGKPKCDVCPLQARCVAFDSGRTTQLPVPKPKKAIPHKRVVLLLLLVDGQILLEQRPPSGIWGGLQSLPELVGSATLLTGRNKIAESVVEGAAYAQELAAGQVFAQRFGQVCSSRWLDAFDHVFTHFRLRIEPLLMELTADVHVVDAPRYHWVPSGEWESAPLPSPIKKLLLSLRRTNCGND